MAVVSIENDADFSLQVLHKTGIVMVYFWASWCGPCKMVRSEIENVAEKMASTVHAVCVNVDIRQDIAEKYDIMAVPTLLFFKDGKPLRRIIGYTSQEEMYLMRQRKTQQQRRVSIRNFDSKNVRMV